MAKKYQISEELMTDLVISMGAYQQILEQTRKSKMSMFQKKVLLENVGRVDECMAQLEQICDKK